jgi:hypothetical protein
VPSFLYPAGYVQQRIQQRRISRRVLADRPVHRLQPAQCRRWCARRCRQ